MIYTNLVLQMVAEREGSSSQRQEDQTNEKPKEKQEDKNVWRNLCVINH